MLDIFAISPKHLSAVKRARAALTSNFPAHAPAQHDGWRILMRHGRPIAMWDLKRETSGEPTVQKIKRLEIAQALAAVGLIVTLPSGTYTVYFAEIPADRSSPRHTVVECESALSVLLGGSHLVIDTWTGVQVATARTADRANERCAEFTRAQNTLEAKVASLAYPQEATPTLTLLRNHVCPNNG